MNNEIFEKILKVLEEIRDGAKEAGKNQEAAIDRQKQSVANQEKAILQSQKFRRNYYLIVIILIALAFLLAKYF